jgi:hypothetical protein
MGEMTPDSIVALRDFLRELRWRMLSRARSESFGDVAEVFARDGVAIRLVRERSQWFIDIGRRSFCRRLLSRQLEYFDLDAFLQLIAPETALPVDETDERARFVIDHLDEICACVKTADGRRGLRGVLSNRATPFRTLVRGR